MLPRALIQTSLVLWLAQQTLQGGVKPQSVSWGRAPPAGGVGIGIKPGGTGALGALGSRYGSKAMKTGLGRYPGAQLGVGGYRALGLGGRAGLKQGGYGGQGAYGASLGTGMALGAGLNGLGLGLGQGGKRVYGAGLGTLPGYGAAAGIGYPGARPGVTTADLGGPEMANVGQAVRDLKSEKSRALGQETPSMSRGDILGPASPELHVRTGFGPAVLPPGGQVRVLDPAAKSSSLGSLTPLEKQRKILSVLQIKGRGSYEPAVWERRGAAGHGGPQAAGGARQQTPLDKDAIRSLASAASRVQSARDSSIQQNQRAQNCGSTRDSSDVLEINRRELLGPETQRTQGLVPQDSKHAGRATAQAQEERSYRRPPSQTQDFRGNIFSLPEGQAARIHLSAAADKQGVKDLKAEDTNGPRVLGRGSSNLPVHGGGSSGPVIPGEPGTQSLGFASVAGQEAKGFTAGGHEAKHLSPAEREVTEPKALSVPGQTGRKSQATSYVGGAGNYLGANLGAGGYGPGLGQGAYLGGAAGKLGAAALGQGGYPQGAAGRSTGYGEGAAGYLGAMAGNGFGGDAGAKGLSAGYGNGYSDGYGAGLGYPAELADGAENKARKSEALSAGGYAGHVQGAYGAHGAGLESTGGKYGGGAAQAPYGHAPVIPTGLEGDGGYPYAAQQLALGAEGVKTASKYGAGTGYGAQQAGYGAQLGAAHDALGEQAGKYGGVNGALGNGYKG